MSKHSGIRAIFAMAAVGIALSACALQKDPKLSLGALPDAAQAADAIMAIGIDGQVQTLNGQPSLCDRPEFRRPIGARTASAVRLDCWDGTQ